MGRITRYVYDTRNRLVATLLPDGTSTRLRVDGGGRIVATIDQAGAPTTAAYDKLGRKTRETLPDPDGAGPLASPSTAWGYDSRGNLAFVTPAFVGQSGIAAGDPAWSTHFEYDALGHKKKETQASQWLASATQGRRTFTTYDALNRPVAVRSPRPDTTSATPVTTSAYDVTGNLVQSTDRLGRTTWRQYDALGRVTAETSPLGRFAGDPQATSRIEYDSAGRVTATIDELGRRTDTVYDSLGRTIRTLAPDAGQGRPTTHFGYDSAGNLRFTTDPRGGSAGDPGFTTYVFYDALGRKTATVDALGQTTDYAYDARGRVAAVTDALGFSTVTTYDSFGNTTSVTDASGNVTRYTFDRLNRLVTETDTANPAATTAWQLTYDALGNVVKSRMAPGEIAQQPALGAAPNPPGSLASGDSTIDWDGDGVAERYDGYPITLAVGDQLLLTASATAFDPVLLLQRPDQGLDTAFFDDQSGGGTTARLLVTADVAGTWFIAVTARDENASGGYALQIVKDQHAIVPTALVEYDFAYDKAGNLISATEDQAAVANMYGFGPAAAGLGVQTSYTVDALNRVTRYRHIAAGRVTKRADFAYRADSSVGSVTRFAGAGVNPIGTSTAAYDAMGRLTGITHAPTAGINEKDRHNPPGRQA